MTDASETRDPREGTTTWRFTPREWALLATPPVLTATMYVAFVGLVDRLGFERGYLAAFALYWVGWCLLLPAVVLGGPREVADLFREATPRFGDRPRLTIGLLAWARWSRSSSVSSRNSAT